MSRPYSRSTATRDAGYRSRYSDEHDYAEDSYDYDDADTGAEYEYEYPADYHDELDRRWIWVAGVAGVILMVAVICTGVILGGGDSGSVSATQASTSTAEATTAAPTTTSAPAPVPAPPVQQTQNLPAETVTTVTPTPSPTAITIPPVTEAPAAAPAPAVDPAAARTITYTVTGNRQMLDLVTIIYTDQQGALQTDVNAALPWSKTVTLDPGVQLSSVTATSIGAQLNCAITDAAGAPLVTQANNTIIATCTK
jgi:hypothetical protein